VCHNLFMNHDIGLTPGVELVTVAEAARRSSVPDRTIHRWVAEGIVRQYWWPTGQRLLGPRVSSEEVSKLRPKPTRSRLTHWDSRAVEFLLNQPYRGSVAIIDVATGKALHAVVVRQGSFLTLAAAHPDGLLVMAGTTPMKVVPSLKTYKGDLLFTSMPADLDDLELAEVSPDPRWRSATAAGSM
jgi:hypothetical protein